MVYEVFPVLSEYLDELKQYGPTYSQWAGMEEDLMEPLTGVADCMEQCGKQTEEQIQNLSEILVPALHEYLLCVETLRVRPTPQHPSFSSHQQERVAGEITIILVNIKITII